MRLRVANAVMLAAALILLTGVAGFLFGSGPATWDELVVAVRWYGAMPWVPRWLLLGTSVIATGVWGVHFLLARRNDRRFRAEAVQRVAGPRLPAFQQRLDRACRRLEEGLTRGRHNPEVALDALLATLVDLEGRELRLEPGPLLVTVSVLLDEPHPVASLADAQYSHLLEQVREVSGSGSSQPAGDELEGEIEYRSHSRVDRIGVRGERDEGMRGPVLVFRPLAPGRSGGKRPAILHRLEHSRAPERHPTGELVTPSYVGPDEITDSRSGLLTGVDPAAEIEIAPVVPPRERRPILGTEAWLRLAGALLLFVMVLFFFAPAQRWGLVRLLGGPSTAPWRDVELLVRSRPGGARVSVSGDPRGPTPVQLREPCGGRPLQIIVEKAGYLAWQWNGICPVRGALRLDAELQPDR